MSGPRHGMRRRSARARARSLMRSHSRWLRRSARLDPTSLRGARALSRRPAAVTQYRGPFPSRPTRSGSNRPDSAPRWRSASGSRGPTARRPEPGLRQQPMQENDVIRPRKLARPRDEQCLEVFLRGLLREKAGRLARARLGPREVTRCGQVALGPADPFARWVIALRPLVHARLVLRERRRAGWSRAGRALPRAAPA